MTGALVARGASIQEALLAAVHLHGLAGDAVAANHGGLIGVTAGEVATAARLVANRMVYGT
jgi:NAD(P)H-hydrate repair Nnr-like enzyme with NAD(P)H-hydrate dehydratase domain